MSSYSIERFTGCHAAWELVRWAKELRYFYLFGEFFSGQAEFYEELVLRIKFSDKEDFIEKIRKITHLRETPEKVAPFESVIYDFQEFLQPNYCEVIDCEIKNSCCFITVGRGFFEIKLFGNGEKGSFGVSEKNIADAQIIEKQIDKLSLQSSVDHSISEFFNCISAHNFPGEFVK
ncbi:MAG: hypothetical protein OHK0038_20980 [Flammeovirgaceae bacterium]